MSPNVRSLRRMAKSIVEGALGAPLVVTSLLRGQRGRRLILSYHNVIPGSRPLTSGDRSLHLPLKAFREQLDTIQALGVSVVPLDTSIQPDRPTIAITFDDAYAGALTFALPELQARGLPSTVFVAPGLLGLDAPWWDRLADPALGAVPPAVRDTCLYRLGGDESTIAAESALSGWLKFSTAPEHRIGTESDLLDALRASPQLTLGAHTWSHPNVASLEPGRLVDELTRPLGWLRERFDSRVIPWLAYPYGLESPAARRAAEEAGYRGALRVTGGWVRESDSPMGLPRLNITPGLSLAGFRIRLAGFGG